MSAAAFNRATRLARNPHNLSGIAGCPPMTLNEYWRARFEREGAQAANGAANPYKPGTMAFERWQGGRALAVELLAMGAGQ